MIAEAKDNRAPQEERNRSVIYFRAQLPQGRIPKMSA